MGAAPQFENARISFNKGKEFAKNGLWKEAAAAYEEALQLDPYSAETHLNLGFVYYELGYDSRAQQELETARKLQACCG
jgi:tetratricopeptide (TPR) repeat protein